MKMKNLITSKFVFIALIIIFLAGIFLPKLLIKDGVLSRDAAYPRQLAYQVLDNPFDRILTLTTSVKQTDEENWLVTAHTFAGIKYATILVNQDGSASLVSKLLFKEVSKKTRVTTFEECAAAGYPVVESDPRRCYASDEYFVEDVPLPTGPLPPESSDGAVCTMEAKLCPDGSAVGRTGPNCEFAPCPRE